VSLLTPAPVAAQPCTGQAGSVLIFPLFDSRPESSTVISISNTNTSTRRCAGDTSFKEGDVTLHYVYFGAEQADIDAGNARWQEFDRLEDLSPGDTLSVLVSEHNPEGEIGFLMVQAIDAASNDAIDFDFLIGSAYVANSGLDIMWSYLPYAFGGDPEEGGGATSPCGHKIVGFAGQARFDGDMYAKFPDVLFVDSFFEEGGIFDNQLVLMSTAGSSRQNEVQFLFWNNREERFSRTLRFTCWMASPLGEISGIARNLDGDPDEFEVQTGWAEIDGRRILTSGGTPVNDPEGPPLLGVFMQSIRTDFTAGHQLHFRGTQGNAILP
jgi:hypothetical protein